MTYPKPIMRLSELKKIGFPEALLRKAVREPGQTFATRTDPYRENSPIVFDTEGFEVWRKKQARATQAAASLEGGLR